MRGPGEGLKGTLLPGESVTAKKAAKAPAKTAPKAAAKPAAKAPAKAPAKPAHKAPAKADPKAAAKPLPKFTKAPAAKPGPLSSMGAPKAGKAEAAEPVPAPKLEKLAEGVLCQIEVLKDGHFFIARTQTDAGHVKEYKNTVFEDLLTEMLITLQEQLAD